MTELQTEGLVVAAVDGSKAGLEVLQWARREADIKGMNLDVIYVAQQVPFGEIVAPVVAEHETERHEAFLKDFITESLGAEAFDRLTSRVAFGEPGKVLVEASHHADEIVVGTRGHGTVVGRILGSVSLYCVTHASCPVIVLPDAEDAAHRRHR